MDIREKIKLIQTEYNGKLFSMEQPKIVKALNYLEQKKQSTIENLDSEITCDDDVLEILNLIQEFQGAIKKAYIENGEVLTHTTDISPTDMKNGKILRSKNRENYFRTERGDWVFASSEPIDGHNPYLARKSQDGAIAVAKSAYVFGGDNIDVKKDEQGKSRVVLKTPNYIYKINPQNFMPVASIQVDRQDNPFLKFSEEWVSESDVDIYDVNQVYSIEKVTDITDVVKNFHVLCDVNKTGEAMKIRACSPQEFLEYVPEAIISGRLRYINEEADINVNSSIRDAINRKKKVKILHNESKIQDEEDIEFDE